MARISIQSRALNDPRFQLAGQYCNPLAHASPKEINYAFGLMLAIKVWDMSNERGTDTLDTDHVDCLHENLSEILVEADLLEYVGDSKVRVKGWHDADNGYLKRFRYNGSAGGTARASTSERAGDGTFKKTKDSPAPVQRKPASPAALTLTLTPVPDSEKNTCAFFDKFWTAYPRKIGKRAAQAKWKTLKLNPLLDQILRAVEAQKKTESWRKDNGQFIPHPATWLNRGSWDDEIDVDTSGVSESELEAEIARRKLEMGWKS